MIPHISNVKKKRTVGWIVHGLSIVASFFRCPGHLEGDEQIRTFAHSYTSSGLAGGFWSGGSSGTANVNLCEGDLSCAQKCPMLASFIGPFLH